MQCLNLFNLLTLKAKKNFFGNFFGYRHSTTNSIIFHKNGSFTFIETLCFREASAKKQVPFNLSEPNTLQANVFTSSTSDLDRIAGPCCLHVEEDVLDRDSWSLTNEETSVVYGNKLLKQVLEGHILPALHFDRFGTVHHLDRSVLLHEEVWSKFQISNFGEIYKTVIDSNRMFFKQWVNIPVNYKKGKSRQFPYHFLH